LQPGNWLTYEFTFALPHPSLLRLRTTLNSLRAVDPLPLFVVLPPNSLPRTISLPSNPTSSLSSIVPHPFPTRYLLEGLISFGVVTPEDLTTLCACLRTRESESLEMRNKLLVAMFAMGRVSGRIKQVLDGEVASSSRLAESFADPRRRFLQIFGRNSHRADQVDLSLSTQC